MGPGLCQKANLHRLSCNTTVDIMQFNK